MGEKDTQIFKNAMLLLFDHAKDIDENLALQLEAEQRMFMMQRQNSSAMGMEEFAYNQIPAFRRDKMMKKKFGLQGLIPTAKSSVTSNKS